MQYSHYRGDCLHLQGYLELGGKYHSVCAHAFCMILSSQLTYLKKLRVIKEYFMGKVILGFVGSNSNMAFAITDVVIWLFKFAVKYIIYFTEF